MTDSELKDLLIKEMSRSRGSLIKRLRDGSYPELADFIMRQTSFIDEQKPETSQDYFWLYRIYCVIHGLTDFPKCSNPNCFNKIDKPSGFLGEKKGFRQYCCVACGTRSKNVVENRIKTCLSKYGVSNTSKLDSIREKIKKTRILNNSNTATVEKSRSTRYLKNGGRWHAGDFADKVRQTKIDNGHSADWCNHEKAIETNLKKYGVSSILELARIRNSSKQAVIRRSYDNYIVDCQYDEPLFTFEEYLTRLNDNEKLRFKCKKCGYEFSSAHHDGRHSHCPICYPKMDGSSIEENELFKFISELNPSERILRNVRNVIPPSELDIYIPDKRLSFEFDGLFWHSDYHPHIDISYHLNKTLQCERLGIQLIHIFEDEWIEKREIVKSRIKNLFGIFDRTVFARKCRVGIVDSLSSEEFQRINHIQGAVRASVHLGLYFEDELISLMTFGKSRFSKKYEWELLRFCNKLGYHVPGAASRLLKHFEDDYQPRSLISYADRRWSRGKLYKALGFDLIRQSRPNYWYVDNLMVRYSRIQFQKHKLSKILNSFDPYKTEIENMRDNGYFRIFDCGNLVFVKEYRKYGENEKMNLKLNNHSRQI